MNSKQQKKAEGLQNRINVLSDHFQLLNHWLEMKGEGKCTVNYFGGMGYHHIAIYGMADLAIRLLEDLEGSSVSTDYGIDQDISCSLSRIDEVHSPKDALPETEAIVVTPYAVFVKKQIEDLEFCLSVERTIAQTLYEAMMIEYSIVKIKKFMADQKLQRIAIYGMESVGEYIAAHKAITQ